jgi:hypothetical protein
VGLKRQILTSAATIGGVGLAIALAGPAMAVHSWSDYHWSTTDSIVGIPIVDNTTGDWPSRVAAANGDWNASYNIESPLQFGTNNPRRCAMALDTIQVCNASYGSTGWLGIASISISGGHIVAGSTKLNDTYFSMQQYSAEEWKQLVVCQEIGHDYGLGHQNEDFKTDATSSCMEYTSNPKGNTTPNAHDREQLGVIYNSHIHAGGGGSGGSGGPGGPGKGGGKKLGIDVGDSPAEWGKTVGKDAAGRANEFVRNFNGYTIITFVTWAPDVKRSGMREIHFDDL